MQIISRLKVLTDGKYQDAVLLREDCEEYPVFLESLINTAIFPALIESGYSLTSLPYGFYKDGTSLDDLPESIISPTEDQLEDMYNMIGMPVPTDELKQYLSTDNISTYNLPKTEYTIFTREEFLAYLDMCATIDNEDDVKPINYFVAPEARFNFGEYTDAEYSKYVKIMTERRALTVRKLDKLIAWLQQINLRPNPSGFDVVEAYMAWGMDGLNHTLLDYKRENSIYELTPSRTQLIAYSECLGALDNLGNILVPEHYKGMVWEPNTIGDINTMAANLPTNGIQALPLRCKTSVEKGTLYCKERNIEFSNSLVYMSGYTFPTLFIKSMADATVRHTIDSALPSKREEYMTDITLKALAVKLYDMRKCRKFVSSYKALTLRGLSPDAALRYVLLASGTKLSAMPSLGEDLSTISTAEIDSFLQNELDGFVAEQLQNVMDGAVNCDNIDNASRVESSINTESTYHDLYCVHHFLGVSLETILQKILMIDKDTKSIKFEGNNYFMEIDTTPIRYKYNAYLRDVQEYDLKAADESPNLLYVTRVARAVGKEDCRKHIAFEGYRVFRDKEAETLLTKLKDDYLERVNRMLNNEGLRAKFTARAGAFAAKAFFEVVFKHEVSYPKELGGDKVPAMPSMIEACKAKLFPVVESTLACTKHAFTGTSHADLHFSFYCCNAYITTDYVIPREGVTLKEVPFYSLWYYWQKYNPGVFAQLVERGVIPSDFQAWVTRYFDQGLVDNRTADTSDVYDNLLRYYNAVTAYVDELPNDMDFIVPTPLEMTYASFWDEDSIPVLKTPRTEKPVVRLGVVRDITFNDYKDFVFPEEESSIGEQYIREFITYDAESIIYCDNVLDKVPDPSKKPFYVAKYTKSLVLPETREIIDFRRILELDPNEYSFIQLYGRVYLLRDTSGKLWEVRI